MANPEHVALVKEGVEVWNSWYEKHRRVVPDFSQANFSNLNLSGINFKKANLERANFSHADLSKAQFVNACLTNSNLLGANLNNANLKGANLDYAILFQALINRHTLLLAKYQKVHEIVNHQSENKDYSGVDLSNSNLF
ncbi:MAG: pentapeptide repeat-containing protein, partial [Cyanobacteria bacterium J06623_1]